MNAHNLFVTCARIFAFTAITCGFASASTDEDLKMTYFQWPTYLSNLQAPGHIGMDFGVFIGVKLNATVRRGQIFPIPMFGALFFKQKDDLLKFEETRQEIGSERFITPGHVVRAITELSNQKLGGEVYDVDLGDGYILIIPDNLSYARLFGKDPGVRAVKDHPFIIHMHKNRDLPHIFP